MSKVLACFKQVICEEDIDIYPDLSLSFNRVERKISDYDRNAIEAANILAKQLDASSICMTYGSSEARTSIKDALSRGPEEAVFINDESARTADSSVTGTVLAAAVLKVGEVSIVICADGSADVYQKQTAPRIAARLDWPVITNVISAEIEKNQLVAIQKLDDGQRTVRVVLPCVIAVLPEVCKAPTPGMRDVLGAGKKPVTEWTIDDLGVEVIPKVTLVKTEGFVMQRKNNVFFEGSDAEKIAGLVAALKREGVL